MDLTRLGRIDRRLARWVDDGQLPGFLVTVSRRVGSARRPVRAPGRRERPAGGGRHPLADLLHDQAGHLGRGDDAVRGGRLRAQRPHLEVAARVRRDPRLRRRVGAEAGHRPAGRADPRVAPADPHVRPDLRLPPRAPGRRDVPRDGPRVGHPPGADSAEVVRQWASVPLVFQPGSEWNYGVSTDVLGRLVEVLSGQPLDEFFEQRIFAPPGCAPRPSACVRTTTPPPWPACTAHAGAAGRAATGFAFLEAFDSAAHTKPAFLSGGGGLVSTAGDYLRFVEVLRRRGAYDGGRLLGPRTIAHMVRNHLPGNPTWRASAGRCSPRRRCAGGLRPGLLDGDRPGAVRRRGERRLQLGRAASTAFYVDPVEDITVSFYTQLLPSSTLPIRSYLRAMVKPGHRRLIRRRSPWTPPAPWSKEGRRCPPSSPRHREPTGG